MGHELQLSNTINILRVKERRSETLDVELHFSLKSRKSLPPFALSFFSIVEILLTILTSNTKYSWRFIAAEDFIMLVG